MRLVHERNTMGNSEKENMATCCVCNEKKVPISFCPSCGMGICIEDVGCQDYCDGCGVRMCTNCLKDSKCPLCLIASVIANWYWRKSGQDV